MKYFKYLFAYTIPLAAYVSINSFGWWTYFGILYVFVVIPMLDTLFGQSESNLSREELSSIEQKWVFDLYLYLNFPIVFGLVLLLFLNILNNDYGVYEYIGLALSSGVLLATNGINVAHELGHRKSLFSRLVSQFFYVPCLYMHFYLEHNHGHHLRVATPEDGATARFNQNVYSFWITSVSKQYLSAWKIQLYLLKQEKVGFLSLKNNMLIYQFIQTLYLILIYLLFSLNVMLFAVLIGVISFLFLECINYIEHYGLIRLKTRLGRYERVKPHHSWNSNFIIGRITLYELTRHSDHHYNASKKYQVLKSYEESPTLPFGYPASILLCLIPPLWFKIMNPLVPKIHHKQRLN